jgi:hypothetical protein
LRRTIREEIRVRDILDPKYTVKMKTEHIKSFGTQERQ